MRTFQLYAVVLLMLRELVQDVALKRIPHMRKRKALFYTRHRKLLKHMQFRMSEAQKLKPELFFFSQELLYLLADSSLGAPGRVGTAILIISKRSKRDHQGLAILCNGGLFIARNEDKLTRA